MNYSHNPQIFFVFTILGLCLALCPLPARAFSPEAESALEILRGNVSAGLAGQEAYHAFLDFLAEEPEADCEALLARPEVRRTDARFSDIREALAEACRDAVPAVAASEEGQAPPLPFAPAGRDRASGRFSISRTVHPRRDTGGQSSSPMLRGEGTLPGIAWRLALREYRPYHRYIRIGSRGVFLHAGHLHSALERTRLDFVAGSRFYAGWRGASGAGDLLRSPQAALDGAGASAQAGAWTVEAAGTWNRLEREGGMADPERRDALLYVAGFALETRPALNIQAAHQRFETSQGAPASVTILGGAISGAGKKSRARWRVGLAGSLPQAHGRGLGTYAEAFLESPESGPEKWRLDAHQADGEWANPLQSPRGYLRDTLDGRWILPGRGEGGLSGRARFPVLVKAEYCASLRAALGSDWSLSHGPLAGEGTVGLAQEAGAWTLETGSTLAYRTPGLAGLGLVGQGSTLSWGQSLSWRQAPWKAKASLTGAGGGQAGSRPRPRPHWAGLALALEYREREGRALGVEIAARDLRYPARYLRFELRQHWPAGRKLKVGQSLRLPWTPKGPGSDMGYQLRLEAAL